MKLILLFFLLIYFPLKSLITIENRSPYQAKVNLIKKGWCRRRIVKTLNLNPMYYATSLFNESLGMTCKGLIHFVIKDKNHDLIICDLCNDWTYNFEILPNGIWLTEEYKKDFLDQQLRLNPRLIYSFEYLT